MRTVLLVCCIAAALTGCERETRRFRDTPAGATAAGGVTLSNLQPGSKTADYDVDTFYEGNAYAVAEGRKLYLAFNCVGCHANGGGGMGPPLMDDRWIYGSDPENIYATIIQGRPNGMPSFRGRIPADRVWWIVAYVRSMSGLTPKNARTGRDDDMQIMKPPLRKVGSEEIRSQNPTTQIK